MGVACWAPMPKSARPQNRQKMGQGPLIIVCVFFSLISNFRKFVACKTSPCPLLFQELERPVFYYSIYKVLSCGETRATTTGFPGALLYSMARMRSCVPHIYPRNSGLQQYEHIQGHAYSGCHAQTPILSPQESFLYTP